MSKLSQLSMFPWGNLRNSKFAYVQVRLPLGISGLDEPPSPMSTGLIARKLGMSRVFLPTGEAIPVTFLRVEPNVIIRTKTKEKDGYDAIVLGIGAKKWKTRKGKEHTRYAIQKEWRVPSLDGLEPGKSVTAEILAEAMVTITG